MRSIQIINDNWLFSKDKTNFTKVSIPHTWNNIDGTDGGNDYYRGECVYKKKLNNIELKEDEELFLEFKGVSQSSKIYLNDSFLGEHLGGYSKYRYNITEYLKGDNELVVYVDNSERDYVYPQKADFTFYGGIYRDVSLIKVNKKHFSLSYYGTNGLKVTPNVNGEVLVEAFFENVEKGEVTFSINDISKNVKISDNFAKTTLKIKNPHLWNGVKDPYLYTLEAKTDTDKVETRFGFREFKVDPEKGFILNGQSYPLNGVSRHQDRELLGCALTKKEHKEDLDIIKSMGANTIRLAHYQHDDYVYDLSDEFGFVLWAEIPYITQHMENADSNAESQLKELILQQYNHPSIVVWGLSNEITTVGGLSDEIYNEHVRLNNIAHELDKTRLTTMANLFMLETDSKIVNLPDVRSYNLYYGWYVGEKEDNDAWFDDFHKSYPTTAIGLSEFGADANPQYQSDNPTKGDYSETYQALYHEHMLKMRSTRPYIWALHVWNMFDFAADGRQEGGKNGQNQKGLVTFDRKTYKDAFYIYKAYLSDEAFVHICDKRYVKRTSTNIKVKVYSNQKEVSLYLNNKLIETKTSDKVFIFDVKLNKGLFAKNNIKAVSGTLSDVANFKVVKKPCESYTCPSFRGNVKNWFEEDPFPQIEGYFSIYDKVGDIKANPEGAKVYEMLMNKMIEKYGDVAKNAQIPKALQQMMNKMSFAKMMKMAGHGITTETVKEINDALNKIKK